MISEFLTRQQRKGACPLCPTIRHATSHSEVVVFEHRTPICAPCSQLVGPEKSLSQQHADRHCRHEEKRFDLESAQIGECRSRTEPAQAPAQAEKGGSNYKPTVNRRR